MSKWNLPSYLDYDEPEEFNPCDYGYVKQEEIPDLHHASKLLKGIVDAIYESGNIMDLENCLDELGDCLDVKLPDRDPVLEKKGPKPIRRKK